VAIDLSAEVKSGVTSGVELKLWIRIEVARCWFPAGARCLCGEQRPLALVRRPSEVICYECDARRRGLSGLEDHHLGGAVSPFDPIRIRANDHRVLSVIQDVVWRERWNSGSVLAVIADVCAALLLLVVLPVLLVATSPEVSCS
jgi:hypothetical protein